MANWNGGGYQQQPYQPPPAPRRSILPMVLIAATTLVVVLVVAIVVVVSLRKDDDVTASPSAAPPTAPSTAGTGFDECLIGNWLQKRYTATFDLRSVVDAKGEAVGSVKLSGQGRRWRITLNGTGTETFDDARYTGTTTDGRSVAMTFTGANDWKLKTSNGKLLFESTGATVQMTVTVDGAQAVKDTVNPQNNPVPYTCAATGWTATSLSDPTASATFERAT